MSESEANAKPKVRVRDGKPYKDKSGARDSEGFSVRERSFVHAFAATVAKDGKGSFTEAAKMIGVSAASAGCVGSDLARLPHVQKAISELIMSQAKKFDLSAERILQEIGACAFANMKDYLQFGEDGSAKVDWSNLTPEQTAAISEVTIDEYQERTGEYEDGKPTYETVKRIRFKLHDKKGHLEMLGRWRKLFTDNVAHSNPDGTKLAPTVINVKFSDKPMP